MAGAARGGRLAAGQGLQTQKAAPLCDAAFDICLKIAGDDTRHFLLTGY
jgi:hypothetical protein